MCQTLNESQKVEPVIKRGRGRPRKNEEDKVSPAESRRRWLAVPGNREKRLASAIESRRKRTLRIKALEKYVDENNILL
jgi:hypothetical protein